jgi:GTPase SAR1 family protein
MNSIANYKNFDGYVDFKNKAIKIGPVNGEIVSNNKEFIIMKIVGDTESIWDTPDYSKLDLLTGNFYTKVNGISETTIGNCVEK